MGIVSKGLNKNYPPAFYAKRFIDAFLTIYLPSIYITHTLTHTQTYLYVCIFMHINYFHISTDVK